MGKRWIQQEEEFLRVNHRLGAAYCATALGKSYSAIENKLARLKLFTRRWKESDKEFLREHYVKDNGPTYCCSQLGLTLSQVTSMAHVMHLSLNEYERGKRASSFDYDKFTTETPEWCYILGLLWADGNLQIQHHRIHMTLVASDFETVLHLFPLEIGWKHRHFCQKNRRPVIQVRAHHVLLCRFLVEYDYQIKSGASADKILSCIPDRLKHYWWRGYFDGDGWFNYKAGLKYSFGFSSCRGQDWSFFHALASQLGIKYYISNRQRANGDSSEIGCGNFSGTQRLGEYIYQGYDEDHIGFVRKHQKFIDLVKTKNAIHQPI